MKKIPELLAPAGSMGSLIAAVKSGADAVYLGGPLFNARRSAENFTFPLLGEAIAYAHIHGVRVYVTLNTLVYEREIEDITKYLLFLHTSGADAILIQDAGVLAKARNIVPGLPLHASTQAGIHNSAGVLWAARNGFSRIVLARELRCAEIREIIKKTEKYGIGVEVFAHGALCYSYSGQCLLSSVIGGRSGNRGLCAQPCRKPYTLVRGIRDIYGRYKNLVPVPIKEQYLLSMKDLSLYPILDKVVDTGVTAIKIEGRLRSPEYVKTVTSVYRKALDSIARGSFFPVNEEVEKLLAAFNRGFTTGYIGEDSLLFSRERPDNRGIQLGTVMNWDNNKRIAEIQAITKIQLNKGDGVAFQSVLKDKPVRGFSLPRDPLIQGNKIFLEPPFTVPKGSKVFLTSKIKNRELDTSCVDLKIPITITLSIDTRGALLFEGSIKTPSGKLIPVYYEPFEKLEPARNAPLSRETIIEHMKKEDTLFQIQNLTLNYGGGFFTPISILNKIRRGFFQYCKNLAGDLRVKRFETLVATLKVPEKFNTVPTLQKTRVKRCELSLTTDIPEGIDAALKAGADIIYFEPDFSTKKRFSLVDSVLNATSRGYLYKVPVVWVWPRMTHDDEVSELCSALNEMSDSLPGAIMIQSAGLLELILNYNPKIPLIGGPGLNITNHLAIEEYSKYFQHLILSYECSLSDITDMMLALPPGKNIRIEIIVEGNTPSLFSRDILPESLEIFSDSHFKVGDENEFFGLKDGRDRIFPIYKDYFNHTVIQNSVEICLIDDLMNIINSGVTRIGIDARGRTPDYIAIITSLYLEALNSLETHDHEKILERLLDTIRAVSLGGITRGPFRTPLP